MRLLINFRCKSRKKVLSSQHPAINIQTTVNPQDPQGLTVCVVSRTECKHVEVNPTPRSTAADEGKHATAAQNFEEKCAAATGAMPIQNQIWKNPKQITTEDVQQKANANTRTANMLQMRERRTHASNKSNRKTPHVQSQGKFSRPLGGAISGTPCLFLKREEKRQYYKRATDLVCLCFSMHSDKQEGLPAPSAL